MIEVATLPLWASLLVSACVLLGAALTLLGTVGLVTFKTFYARMHAPTLGASSGSILISLGSMILFAVLQNRWIVHEVLIVVFVSFTTPVTLLLLSQAALYRDRAENSAEVPEKDPDGKPLPEPES